MTTKDSNAGMLNAHPEPQKLAAHEEAKQLEAHIDDAPASAADVAEDPIFTNSRKGNIPTGLKWGMAIMLALAVASAVVVCIGLNHHRSTTPADMTAYSTPGGNFLLYGTSKGYMPQINATASAPSQQATAQQTPTQGAGMTATAIGADGKTSIIAISDPTTEVVYLFEVNGASIPDNATLNEFARRISTNGDDVTIVAYTDPTGPASYNQRLSERRAKALGNYLSAHGVKDSHIKTSGKGSTDRFGSERLDRRAELHVN